MIYKGYELRWSKQCPNLIEIGVGENKGALPVVLKQVYTSKTIAKQWIDAYLETKKPKDSNAETVAEGRGK